jgi:hypothetical protein
MSRFLCITSACMVDDNELTATVHVFFVWGKTPLLAVNFFLSTGIVCFDRLIDRCFGSTSGGNRTVM